MFQGYKKYLLKKLDRISLILKGYISIANLFKKEKIYD